MDQGDEAQLYSFVQVNLRKTQSYHILRGILNVIHLSKP